MDAMRRVAGAALLLLLLFAAAGAGASSLPAGGGRRRLQAAAAALDCKKVHPTCTKCRTQPLSKGSSASETVCTACASGWALRAGSNKICDCAAGRFLGAKGTCDVCRPGKWCPGGSKANPKSLASNCPAGTASTAPGAKAITSCLTRPGYGLVTTGDDGKPTYLGRPCPLGTYNPGKNDAPWPSCFTCMNGLTTNTTGATSPGDCIAPAGWFIDANSNMARMCPKGSYTDAPNRAGSCTSCNEGVTTAGEGSASAAACDRAQPGWYWKGDGVAAACPKNTYNDADTTAGACTPCPAGKLTRFYNPVSADACEVPPGHELKDGVVTPCAVNFWKEDWGDRACEPCGAGLFTPSTNPEVVFPFERCSVPPGFGLTSFRPPFTARPCLQNSHGSSEARLLSPFGSMTNALCSSCGPNLATDDTQGGLPPADGAGYTSYLECKVKPGWGITGEPGAQSVERCAQGTYNEGRNRDPCTPCPAGTSTNSTGATSAADCVAVTAP